MRGIRAVRQVIQEVDLARACRAIPAARQVRDIRVAGRVIRGAAPARACQVTREVNLGRAWRDILAARPQATRDEQQGIRGSSGPSAGSGSGPSTPPPPVDPEVARRQAEEAKEKAERMSIARNPSNPEYFRCNLEMLQGGDESEQRHAVAEMAKADPEKVSDAELRKEIARAIRDIAMSEGIPVWTRKEAVPALVVWGSSYSVPILIDLLNTSNTSVKGEAIKQLTKLNDERAIEAVVMAFVQEASLRDEAAAFLRRFGSAAEDPVLKLARPTDFVSDPGDSPTAR